MSLKELTQENHAAAENTLFMKAVFKNSLPKDLWADFTYQKSLFYNAIECCANAAGLLKDLPDIQRTYYLYKDYMGLTNQTLQHSYRKNAIGYYQYILSLYPDADKIMAHLYVWHMGDMFGGQMIKKLVPGPHQGLTFKDAPSLIQAVRGKINDSMADEANVAFDWAIKILKEYDSSLDQNSTVSA
jgi:heme oxygenase